MSDPKIPEPELSIAQIRMRVASDASYEPPCADEHTPCPKGYLAWHEWAAEMEKTHRQEACPKCSLYVIWRPL